MSSCTAAWTLAVTVAGCGAPAEAPTADICAGAELHDDPPLMDGSDSVRGCLAYGWTRVLVGSGSFASVAPDGTVAALSNVSGSSWVTVLSWDGETLGSFPIDPTGDIVRIAPGGGVVAASFTGRIRRFAPSGNVEWSIDAGASISDLAVSPDGAVLISEYVDDSPTEAAHGVLSRYDADGTTGWSKTIRHAAAPALATRADGAVAMTTRDACSSPEPCRASFDPNGADGPMVPGAQAASAVVLLDASGQTIGISDLDQDPQHPQGPLFVKSSFMGLGALTAEIRAWGGATTPEKIEIDVDPNGDAHRISMDLPASPDALITLDPRGSFCWARHFAPMDDTARAQIIGLFASRAGVAVDVNGDVYKVHHVLHLSPSGQIVWRLDRANDGSMNDVALAGIDDTGDVVLSGRFDGAEDFDPGSATDVKSADESHRRYITVLRPCTAR